MRDPFEPDRHSLWIPFADFLSGVLSVFLVVAVLLTFHLTDPAKKKQDADIATPGTINVTITWNEDVDVDLWLRSPGDASVGYSRKQGRSIDLLRDDLGWPYEKVGDHHVENAFARATPAGEYIVNLHFYMNRKDAPLPIKVDVSTVILHKGSDNKVDRKRVLNATVNLTREGEEITVMRFRIDGNAELLPDTVNNQQIPLRSVTSPNPSERAQ